MKDHLIILLFLGFSSIGMAQITNIPDPGFEEALIFLGIDSDGIVNGQGFTSDISSVTTFLIHGLALPQQINVTDITGIEDFEDL
ncbi:MAG: hypothetical protein ACI9M9_001870 [Flavobacteriaceae bacterium]|jgi:hypothetical protein